MIEFALVGCGQIGERHAVQINRVGKLAAVCDIDRKKAETLAAPYGSRVYTSLEELLAKEPTVNVVVVCTPNGLHAEHTIWSLQAGRHVLCEKPMSIAAAAAWSMRDTAHFFRRKLFVVKQNRFNPPIQFVKQLLAQDALGPILSFSIQGIWNRPQHYYTGGWRGTRELDGGMLYTQFSHFIDLLIWLLGEVSSVQGVHRNSGLRNHFDIDDTFVALLGLANGAVGTAHFTINSYEANKEGSFTIVGARGTVKIGGQYLNTLEWNTTEGGSVFPESATGTANNYGFYTGSMSNHHLVYDELCHALAGRPHKLPDINEAVKTVELIEQLYATARPA